MVHPLGPGNADSDWNSHSARALGVQLNGNMIDEIDERGRPVQGATLLVLFNAEHQAMRFRLPVVSRRQYWRLLLDSGAEPAGAKKLPGGGDYQLVDHSLAVFALKSVRLPFLPRRQRSNVGDREGAAPPATATDS